MTVAPSVVALVLAAGAGRRLGQPKAEFVLNGERLLDRVVRAALEGGCHSVLAVVRPGFDHSTVTDGVNFIVNPDPDRGMGSSLRVGMSELFGHVPQPGAAMVLLVDMPGIGSVVVRRVLSESAANPELIVRASFGGAPSHPVVFPRSFWARVATSADGDQGARGLLTELGGAVMTVECGDLGAAADLDTREQVERWTRLDNS